MTIVSRGYDPGLQEQNTELFIEHLDFLLSSEQIILNDRDYFFTPLSFAWCSWPYVSGDGSLPLGYLLCGWKDLILSEPCPECGGTVLVFSFGGSPLSGSNSWSGFCKDCRTKQTGRDSIHKPFVKRVSYVQALRKTFPERISSWEEYDGNMFTWGGNGLQPARKRQLVWTKLANPTSLAELVAELKSGRTRRNPPEALHIQCDQKVKFSKD
ncbi:MAG: hypothetical protein K2W95_18515 [Candidatus Obscuribacterales bacterium]|nr:hypothetical protein [Candidatus Obscuribacterales bacterium]